MDAESQTYEWTAMDPTTGETRGIWSLGPMGPREYMQDEPPGLVLARRTVTYGPWEAVDE